MHSPHPHRFLPVFLLCLTILTEALSLYLLNTLTTLPKGYLSYAAGVLGLLTLLAARGLFPASPRLRPWKQTIACLLALTLTVGSCGAVYTALRLRADTQLLLQTVIPPDTAPWQPAEEPFVVYLGGSDTRSATLTQSRCDVNILAVVNPNTMQLLLVNTPRDTYLPNPAGNYAKDKLTHCGLYGMENSMAALSSLYTQPVSYGAVINFTGFARLIDALGGVTVHSDTAYTTTVGGYSIQKGENHLNGAQALAFARERYHLSGGDGARGENQMQVLSAILRQVSPRQILSSWQDILQSLEGMLTTDFPLSLMARLAAEHLPRLEQWEIFTISLTGSDSTASNYSGGKAYVMLPHADAVAQISRCIGMVLSGERLSEADFG